MLYSAFGALCVDKSWAASNGLIAGIRQWACIILVPVQLPLMWKTFSMIELGYLMTIAEEQVNLVWLILV